LDSEPTKSEESEAVALGTRFAVFFRDSNLSDFWNRNEILNLSELLQQLNLTKWRWG